MNKFVVFKYRKIINDIFCFLLISVQFVVSAEFNIKNSSSLNC